MGIVFSKDKIGVLVVFICILVQINAKIYRQNCMRILPNLVPATTLKKSIRVAIIGDYDPSRVRQVATTTALEHAARKIGVSIEITWVLQAPLRLPLWGSEGGLVRASFFASGEKSRGGPATSQLVTQTETLLADFDAYFGAPGAVTSVEGAIRGIQYARKSRKPFLGTCAGFQYAVLEFARNVAGIQNGASEPPARNLIPMPLSRYYPLWYARSLEKRWLLGFSRIHWHIPFMAKWRPRKITIAIMVSINYSGQP